MFIAHRVDCRGTDCPVQLTPTYNADFVINTATAPATLGIDFRPLLSVDKDVALRTTYYESSSKVLLAFRSSFWEKDGRPKGGSVVTDMPMQVLYYPSVKLSNTGEAGYASSH